MLEVLRDGQGEGEWLIALIMDYLSRETGGRVLAPLMCPLRLPAEGIPAEGWRIAKRLVVYAIENLPPNLPLQKGKWSRKRIREAGSIR